MTATAEHRVLRTIALLFGVGGIVFGLLTRPVILDQLERTPPAWTWPALILSLGLPVALGAAAFVAPPRVLRALGGGVAIGNLLALASVSFVFDPSPATAVEPWILLLNGIGTTGAAIAWPGRLVAADVVLTAVLVTVDRLRTGSGELRLIAVQDGLYAFLLCAVLAALAVGSLQAGRAVDAASRAAAAAEAAARTERIRSEERIRVAALVHDHVLTTLLVAGRSEDPSPATASAAAQALRRLRRLTEPDDAVRPVGSDELRNRLRAQAAATVPGARFTERRDPGQGPLPASALEALVDAAGEALRNVARHAGARVAAQVDVRHHLGAVEVAVRDDGRGFAAEQVPRDRLGIVTSIVERMRAAGGSAEVRSRPGHGTSVLLRWPARGVAPSLSPPLGTPLARPLLAAFALVHAALALDSGPTAVRVTLFALAAMIAAAAVGVLVPGRRLPAGATTAVVLLTTAGAAAIVPWLPEQAWSGYSAWPIGAGTFVAIALALRRRIAVAWLLMGLMAALCGAAGLTTDGSGLAGLAQLERQVGLLGIGTLFAIGLDRAARAFDALRGLQQRRFQERDVAHLELQVRSDAVQQVLDVVGPTLDRIAAGETFDERGRGGILALEGLLRDRIALAPLLTESLNAALGAARARGIDTVVLTDPAISALPGPVIEAAATWIAERLERCRGGELIARVVVRGDQVRVSATVDGGNEELLLLDRRAEGR